MKYENGKAYKFDFDDVTVEATFEGLTEKVVETFNRLCADEKFRAYKEEGGENRIDEAIVA